MFKVYVLRNQEGRLYIGQTKGWSITPRATHDGPAEGRGS
jgi:hypothetical protein